MRLYVIFDRLAEESEVTFEAKTDAVAVRQFSYLMSQRRAGSADEFWLFFVGSIDTRSMVLSPSGPTRIEVGSHEELEGTSEK